MSCTIVIPNRNRDLTIVSKTLSSLAQQDSGSFSLVIVDYGSEVAYQEKLEHLVNEFSFAELIICPTQLQLWHKTRAINIVLKKCTSEFFMVLDMDCIVHPDFVSKAMQLAKSGSCINFPYGFLTEAISKKELPFDQYEIDFVGELTGTIIAKTIDLQNVKGYDEFYHNWGAEDADILARLRSNKVKVTFYDDEILLLHQWHPKVYRSKESIAPYHIGLEKINHSYFECVKTQGITQSNLLLGWGKGFDEKSYALLNTPDKVFTCYNIKQEIKAYLSFIPTFFRGGTIQLTISKYDHTPSLKGAVKAVLGKKSHNFIAMEAVNEMVIELIINRLRSNPYKYSYDRLREEIILVVHLDGSAEKQL